MKSLTFCFLGLALINLPACLSQSSDDQCFSQSLTPAYPCCNKNKVVYTDKDGAWGVQNGEWCGIEKQCFAQSLKPSYPCCTGDKIVYSDESGDWGKENGKWCGIGDGVPEDAETCFSLAHGYPCCKSCKVVLTDESGDWGVENKRWCGIKASCATTDDEKDKEDKEDKEDNEKAVDTNFDFSFLKMENGKKNMLYSPLSIEYALKMLEEGAVENTYSQINEVIGNRELPKYTSIDKVLSLANGLFIRDKYYSHVKPSYIETLKEKYDAEVKEDDFKDAKNANQWIEDKTLGIIKNMLGDEVVQNKRNVMLLMNALAIDMEWASPFGFTSTSGYTFYKDNGEEMIASMMFKKEEKSKEVAYYIDDDITVLTMNLQDYDGVQFEFMAIMPNENLSAFIEKVTKEQISDIDSKLKLSYDEMDGVNVRIPKFKFNYNLKLKDDLKKLGIEDAFDKEVADFSKMAYTKELDEVVYVSDALHKADIEFTEKGVKAAAVTVFVMAATTSMPRPKNPVNVFIDKPFMFLIRDKNTKDIWFTGTVYEPNAWKDEQSSYKPNYDYGHVIFN